MSVRSLLCLVSVGCALAATAPPAAGGVIVVALDGTGATDSVVVAVSAAAPGDIILVREGNYVPAGPLDPGGFFEVDKPLAIIGDGAGATVGLMRIIGIPAGQEVVLRNLTVSAPIVPGVVTETLAVWNCAGTVIVEDCTLIGLIGTFAHLQGFPGVDVRNSAGVNFTRCTIQGGQGASVFVPFPFDVVTGPGGPAIVVDDSKLALHHCTVGGGSGGIDEVGTIESQPGGDALTIVSSTVFAAGGSLTGGSGSDGGPPEQPAKAAGGHGVAQSGDASSLRLVDVTPQGGDGGELSGGTSGPTGEGLIATAGLVQTWTEQARGTSMPATLHEGELATLVIEGTAGEQAKIMVAVDLLHAQLGGKKGVFNLAGPVLGPIFLGTVPASGELEFPVTFPLGTLLGAAGVRIDMQSLTFGVEGLMLGNPTSTLLLAEDL